MRFIARSLLAALIPIGLVACGSAPPAPPPPVYSQVSADYGVVRNIDLVQTRSQSSGGGAIIGGVLGAVIGNQFGAGTGRAAATAAGAVGGAIAGNEIEKRRAGTDQAYRVTIAMDNGSMRTVDVADTGGLQPGERVRVDGNQIIRL